MKTNMLVGIVLIVIGLIALAYGGISYTHREKVVDIGPIHAFADKKETIPFSPIVGGLLLVGGLVVVVTGAKKS